MTATEPVFAAVGPVFELDGQAAPLLARDIVSLTVSEDTAGLRSATVVLHGGSPDPAHRGDAARHLDRRAIDFGQQLEIFLGPDESQRLVFDGVVSSITAHHQDRRPPLVTVCAEDALMRLRMTRRMASYIDVTDAQIAEEIAGHHGLTAEATAEGPRYDVVQQLNQSDLAFLRERARLIQAELWWNDGTLHFTDRSQRQAGELTLVRYNHLIDVHLSADLAHQRHTVVVSGYDAQGQATIHEEAGAGDVTAEAPGGAVGPDLVGEAIGESAGHRVRDGALTDEEARAYARAEMLRRGRQFVTVRGVTRGSPSMAVGTRLTLEQVGPMFEGGDYYVTSVSHRFDLVSGLTTCFEAERSYINQI